MKRKTIQAAPAPTLPPVRELPVTQWQGCYARQWKGIIPDAAFEHPAKFSLGLIQRIYQHALAKGYIRPGELVGDPFGGVGLGGLIARDFGMRWIGQELEPKFFSISVDVLTRQSRQRPELPTATMILGDSRQFAARVSACLTSPPYAGSLKGCADGIDWEKAKREGPGSGEHQKPGRSSHSIYGQTEGQIGRLPEGSLDLVATSCPFSPDQPCQSQTKGLKSYETFKTGEKRSAAMLSEGNIDTLKHGGLDASITSPPYAHIASGNGGLNHLPAKDGQQGGRAAGVSQTSDHRYGSTEGQLAKLPEGTVDSIATSPPWEDGARGTVGADRFANAEKFAEDMAASTKGNPASPEARKAQLARDAGKTYGDTEGQIGKTVKETYWGAMKLVYGQCFEAIKPGGFIMVVVKDYVRAKQRVRLCDDTLRLLEHVGFEGVERIQAMLVEEQHHPGLFEAVVTTKTEKKSFFRRLHENKPGAIKIDYEEVLICRKPL